MLKFFIIIFSTLQHQIYLDFLQKLPQTGSVMAQKH